MAIITATNFTGVDGSAWPSPWTTLEGAATIQSNRGQLATPATAWSTASARANQSFSTGTVYATVRTADTANGSSCINFRFDYATGNGYRLQVGWYYSGFELLKVTNWQTTTIASAPTEAWAANTDYRIALEFSGSTLRAKRWLAANVEPGSWSVSVTEATYTSGDVGLLAIAVGQPVAMTSLWDDVEINNDTQSSVDTTAPVVSLMNPTPLGQTVGYEHIYGTVMLQANVTDDVAVSSVAFYDGNPSSGGTLLNTITAAPYQTSWETGTAADGMHHLYVRAIDSSGNTSVSSAVDVMVNNSGVWVPKGSRAWPVTVKFG